MAPITNDTITYPRAVEKNAGPDTIQPDPHPSGLAEGRVPAFDGSSMNAQRPLL